MAQITTKTIHRTSDAINAAFIGIDTALRYLGVSIIQKTETILTLIDTGGLQDVERLAYIRDAIDDLIEPIDTPLFGAVEGGSYNSGGQLFQLGQAQGLAQIVMYDRDIPFLVVAPTRLKKFFAGNGGASKERMMSRAKNHLDVDEIDDNLADAFALACVAEACFLEAPHTRKQAEVILDFEEETATWTRSKSSDSLPSTSG